MTITPKIYSHCPRKHQARQATIIEPYRALFGYSVPEEQQYWAMCAACANGNDIISGSELDQITEAELIQPQQFHGVDFNRSIYETNRLYTGSNWYCSDFLQAMQRAYKQGNFHPAIINADLINMPTKASAYIAKIFDFLTWTKTADVMVVTNIVLKSHNRFSTTEELEKKLCENLVFRIAWMKRHWQIFSREIYSYNGTDNEKGHSNSVMGSLVFVPSKRLSHANS